MATCHTATPGRTYLLRFIKAVFPTIILTSRQEKRQGAICLTT